MKKKMKGKQLVLQSNKRVKKLLFVSKSNPRDSHPRTSHDIDQHDTAPPPHLHSRGRFTHH